MKVIIPKRSRAARVALSRILLDAFERIDQIRKLHSFAYSGFERGLKDISEHRTSFEQLSNWIILDQPM
jgi:hypothetical protein